MKEDVNKLAQIIWDYHLLHHKLKKADCIFVLGSYDTRVAEYGANLFLQRYAPYIIFSGGHGEVTENIFKEPEANVFANIAIKMGVPKDNIIIENKSTNTGENIDFTKKLLVKKDLQFSSFILVQKPYMERRTFATFKKIWPEKKFIVTSPPISFENYPNEIISKERVINTIVGYLQRIQIYPELGFQIHQNIPESVWSAYKELIKLGYDKQLIKE